MIHAEEKAKPTLYMTVGVPGCGKSSWSASMAGQGVRIFSSDTIRKELLGDDNCQESPELIFSELHSRVRAELDAGNSCIYDATNVSRKRRMNYMNSLPKGLCRRVCVLFLTPPDVCVSRDSARSRTVGKKVIMSFLGRFECPYYYEGWDEIIPVVTAPFAGLPIESMDSFDQENPHHELTLGMHMKSAREYCIASGFPEDVITAAAYHDCGKLYTKTFANKKGEISDVAHYYGHECLGSYLFLLDSYRDGQWRYGSFERALRIAVIISWHMKFFGYVPADVSDKTEKDRLRVLWFREKYEPLLGRELTDEIIMLNEADRHAH